jgi:GTP-binding protein
MPISQSEFIKSSVSFKDCPEPSLPEYAFIGRSNVGKSSLINLLSGKSKLAKTSSTPGKTQLINHFLINNTWYLTDLPGFGFAKVSKSVKGKWELMIKDYLLKRENLICAFFLIDIRHEPMKKDVEFLEWMGKMQLPFTIVFTKSDKIGVNKLRTNVDQYLRHLGSKWEPVPPYVISSSVTFQGRDEILHLIEVWNKSFTAG